MLTGSSEINTMKHQYLLPDLVSSPAGWSVAMTSWSTTWLCCGSAWSSSAAARASQRSRSATWSGTEPTPTCGMPPCKGRWSISSRCTASAAEAGEGEEEEACDQEMKEVETCRKWGYPETRGSESIKIRRRNKSGELNCLAPGCLTSGKWGFLWVWIFLTLGVDQPMRLRAN